MTGAGSDHNQTPRFAFGENWAHFLSILDDAQISEAEESICRLLQRERLDDERLLDIGSGSGLFSLVARRLGATVYSFDYDAQSVACTAELRRRYFPDDSNWIVERGSVLDDDYLSSLGTFDIVYSWGVLHHTGDMWKAIKNAADRVRPGGTLVIAIYNRHRTSDLWLRIKQLYNQSGPVLRSGLVWGYYAARVGSRLIKGRSPYRQRRGMSLCYDVVDWVGGLPYECASFDEVVIFGALHGLVLVYSTCTGSTGCNEFVFRRI